MPGRLEGKVAIITGGASGFGAATSKRFAQEGCKVLICDLNESGAQDVASKLDAECKKSSEGGAARGFKMNVCERDDWAAAVKACVDNWGRVDVCVNNAGTSYKNKVGLELCLLPFIIPGILSLLRIYAYHVFMLPFEGFPLKSMT